MVDLIMANLFAFEGYRQAAQWSGPPSSIVDGPYAAARYSVDLEQQLAALKRAVATLRHHQTTDPRPELAQPTAACADWSGFAEVEHYLAELERTVGACYHCGKYCHDIVHSQPDPICRFGADFKLTFANETFATLYNKPLTELLSTSLFALLPDTEQAAVTAQLTALTPSAPMTTVETSVVLADGTQRWFAWTYQLLVDDQDHFLEFQAVGRDVTAHKQAITAEREQRYLAEALRDSLAALTGPLPLDEMMQRILDATATVVPNDAGSIILFEQTQARVAYVRGFTPTATAFFHDYRFALHELVPDGVITNACAYLVPDTVTDPDWLPLPVSAWIRSSIGVPILLRGQPIGLLMLDSATPHTFQPTDVDKLQLFAQYASLALENADHIRQLEERVAARTTELQVAKAQVETILQHSPDAIFLVAPDLRIQQTNTAFQTMMGGEAVATFTGSLLDLIAAADAAYVTATLHAVITQNTSQHVEVCACRYDGVRFDGELSIAPLQGGSFICTLRDISKRKAYERHLRFYASIQDNLSDAVITTDMTFHIQSWNRAAETIYGWRADEVIGKPVQEVLQTQYVSAAVREEMRQKLFQREGWQGEVVQQRRDGASLHTLGSVTLFYDEQGAPLGVVAVSHDITERKRAENALRESEAQFRRLVEMAPVPIVITDQQGQIVLVNQQAEVLFDYQSQELLGQPLERLVPDDRRQRHRQHQFAYLQDPYMRQMGGGLELFARRRDGRNVPVEIQLSSLETTAGRLVMSFIVDMTERKRTEAVLREQRDFLQLVIDRVPAIILVQDRTNRVLLANHYFAQLFGRTTVDVVGKTDVEFMGPSAALDAIHQRNERVWTRAQPLFIPEEQVADYYFQTHCIPLQNAMGEYDRLLTVASDITARRQAEAAIRRSEAQFRQIVTTMRGGLVLYDLAEQITYANERFCTLSGYSLAELVGSSSFDYVDEASAQLIQDQLIYRRQGEGTSYELVIKRKDGQRIDCLVSGSPLYDEQQTLIGSIAVITDITAQKQAEVLLQEMLQKERELSALKSRVVTTASHELRTPLASILVFTDTLRAYRHKLSDEQVSQRLNGIGDQVNFLRTIIDDLLQLEQLQTGRSELQRTPVDLNLLCRSVLNEFLAQENFRHQMSYRCDAALPMLALDKRLMRQVLVNLVGNALKYSAPATTVCVHLVYTNTQLYISVQDEGIGIPAADLAHLFQPFQRASNVGAIGGTGLGLAIAKEAAEAHGGTITVASEVGKGTTFTVAIPVASKGVLRQ